MNIFCKHDYELISETTTKSKFECANESYGNMSERLTSIKIPHQMCCAERKHIQVFTCKKCGKLKRFVEDI